MPLSDLSTRFNLGSYNRTQLVDGGGTTYSEFRKTLTPHFGKVWLDIGAGYFALAACAAAMVFCVRRIPVWILVPAGAMFFGYVQAYIHLFFHEAAHFNIARNRKWNDILANIFIGLMAGEEIASYRQIHFGHNRHLGDTIDPERTYFDPLNVRFIAEALLGVKSVRVRRMRRKLLRSSEAPQILASPAAKLQPVLGLVLHIALLACFLELRLAPVAIAWAVGTLIFLPFFTALRQLLEHRSEAASDNADYSKVPHGEATRMFRSGPIGSTLGGAGFDRHLLHHWDPQVSYTRLAELEQFLLTTQMAPAISEKKTYAATFRLLFRK